MRRVLTSVIVIVVSGCTLDNQRAPDFVGPSGLGLVLQVTATPDFLPHNGAMQSVVQVSATDTAGQPIAGLSFSTQGFFQFEVVKSTNPLVPTCPTGTFELGPKDEELPNLIQCHGFLPNNSGATTTTGSDGRAFVVFSAPAAGMLTGSLQSEVVATVTVTPLGGSFGDSSFARTVKIGLSASAF